MAASSELRHNIVVKLATPEIKTREAIARSILENGPSSTLTLSERLGITPAGIRRHLDALVDEGIIEAREPRVSSKNIGRGRPSKVFVMTDLGRASFEHSYDDLAISALRFIAQSEVAISGLEGVSAFARARAEDMERKFHMQRKSKAPSQSIDLSPNALAEFLTAEGYAANVHNVPIGVELCQHHCPIAHVAAEFPQLCETETEVFAKILGTHVQRLATIAHGDGVCTTVIPKNKIDVKVKTSTKTGKTTRELEG
ncbi:MAG: transcriptional regulator [Actinobacteria bacterium]|uniref:Transcriptional regulator n=1 Tax=Candidatus Fonsibacter lacus TaxID=2576439 RepID=A0A965LKP8_9PROT|nr:transcriptional regulator [Candidatus Fonsibacter lacus]